MPYNQAPARQSAVEHILDQRILTVWQVSWRQRQGRRLVSRTDTLLSYDAALRKHDLYKALGYLSVDLQPVLVYTHDTPSS